MARKDFGAKPYTYPQPVFILATYNEDGTANAMHGAESVKETRFLSASVPDIRQQRISREPGHLP